MLRQAHHAPLPLVGREGEMALVTSLLDRIGTAGAAVVLRGGPGIGKSRVLAEAARLAGERGVVTLSATGVKSEARLPFSGLNQLLWPVRQRTDRLVPALRAPLEAALGFGEGTSPEPFRIAMAVLDLLSEVAVETALLLIIDDAHWLDRASTDVLAFVARRLESDPIVLLAAARDGFSDGLVDAGLPEFALRGLRRTSAAILLDASERKLSPAVRERILQEADGNPLALTELPLSASPLQGGAHPGVVPLTERLEQAFAARVCDLPHDTRLLLLVAALIDANDLGQVLRSASAVAARSIDTAILDPAIQAAIVDVDARTVRFRHPMMRSAVVQSASVAEQRLVHEVLADDPGADADRSVWHRAALITGVRESVARDLEEAGLRARLRGSTYDAFAAMRRASELSDDGQRARRLLTAAQLAYEVGQPDAAAPLLRAVKRQEPGPLDQARATWMEELVSANPLEPGGIASLSAAAESAHEHGDRDLHIELLWLLALRTWWNGTGHTVQDVLTQASHRLGGAEADDPRVVAIYAYADTLAHTGEVLTRLKRVLETGGSGGTDAARYFGEAALVTGAFDLALPLFREAVEGLRDDGRLGHLARTLSAYAFVAAHLADWDVAVPAAEESRRLAAELRLPVGVARADTVRSMIAGIRGDVETAERLSSEAERLGVSSGSRAAIIFAQFGRIAGRLGVGRYDDAYRSAERLFSPVDPANHPMMASWVIGDLAEAAAHIGRESEAIVHVARVEAAVGDVRGTWPVLGLRHARAVLASSEDRAALRFEEALGADLNRWPFARARLLFAQGQGLRRRRRVAASRAPLRAAREVFDAIGCLEWSARARHELRASGESSPRLDPAARDRLTPQELQIARLAASGLSNRAIGERLYLSPRTISTHLYHVYPKLGVTARTELGVAIGLDTKDNPVSGKRSVTGSSSG